MIIRKSNMGDLDALDEFYTGVVEYLYKTVNWPKWTLGEYPCRESIQNAIISGIQYIACDKKQGVLGAFIFCEDPMGDYSVGNWKKQLEYGEFLTIHTLAVAPSFYGHGVGKAMVNYCLNLALLKKYKAVRLDVVPTNTPAIKLYKKCGFTFAGEKDLNRGIADIPTFKLYEYNLTSKKARANIK